MHVGGVPLAQAVPDDVSIDKQAIADDVKSKAERIIENKGATNFGIGGVAASICKSILFDEKVVRPLSVWQEDLGVCLSTLVVLGREGVVRRVDGVLSKEETAELEKSAKAVKEVVEA